MDNHTTIEPMVTITADEYFNLRSRAETNMLLLDKVSQFESRLAETERRLREMECKSNG